LEVESIVGKQPCRAIKAVKDNVTSEEPGTVAETHRWRLPAALFPSSLISPSSSRFENLPAGETFEVF